VNLRGRVNRLERGQAAAGCGPGCPPRAVVLYRQDGPDAEPVPKAGQGPPAPCPRCGRPADVTEVVVVYDRIFYGNAERLRALLPDALARDGNQGVVRP
jgi:hypothetical protein